ncbi:hypothetical protein D3C75_1156920 [compost metagenome]
MESDVIVDSLKVVTDRIVVSFTRLGHYIADKNFDRIRGYNSLRQLRYKQVGQDARVQAARAA